MTTFVLIHGAGSDSWYWHLVAPVLRDAGHDVVGVDLPCADDAAGVREYADVVVDAIGGRGDVVLVAQSMGSFTAALVAPRVPLRLVVLVAAMVPTAGESPSEWWTSVGHDAAFRQQAMREGRDPENWDPEVIFLHDVPPEVAAAGADHVYPQSDTPFRQVVPMPAWPDVPVRFVLGRDDCMFPADFQRRLVAERLGIVPDEMDGGHLPALAHPDELAARLLAYVD